MGLLADVGVVEGLDDGNVAGAVFGPLIGLDVVGGGDFWPVGVE